MFLYLLLECRAITLWRIMNVLYGIVVNGKKTNSLISVLGRYYIPVAAGQLSSYPHPIQPTVRYMQCLVVYHFSCLAANSNLHLVTERLKVSSGFMITVFQTYQRTFSTDMGTETSLRCPHISLPVAS